jgi:hypothetical protein
VHGLANRDGRAYVVVGVQQERRYVNLGQHVALVPEAGAGYRPEAARTERPGAVDGRRHELALGRRREHRRHHRGSKLVGRKPRRLQRTGQPLLCIFGAQRATPAGVPTGRSTAAQTVRVATSTAIVRSARTGMPLSSNTSTSIGVESISTALPAAPHGSE